MNKEKQLAKNTMLYAIGSFGSKILSFLVVPLYTYYIDTSSMGVYDAIITAIQLIAPVLALSIYEGIYRWVIQDVSKGGKYIRFGLKFEIRNLAVAACIYMVVGQFIEIPYFWIVLIYVILSCLHSYLQRITRALGNVSLYTKTGLLYTATYLTCNILFIVVLKLGVVSLFWSAILGNFIVSVVMFIAQRDEILHSASDQSVEKRERLEIIRLSAALTPNDICWWIVGLSDRFALIYFVSASANGIYAISQKFPTIITMMTSIFYMAWQDQSISDYENRNADDYYARTFRLYSRFLFCACLCLIPVSKYVITVLMDSSYHSSWYYVAPLYIGTVFSALAGFMGVGYLGSKQTSKAFTTTVMAAVVDVGINLIFIPLFPDFGIAIASLSTMISYLTLFIVRNIQTKKYFDIKTPKKEIIFFTAINILYAALIIKTNIVADLILFAIALLISWFCLREYISKVIVFLKRRISNRH